jgi:hypothetical protein
MKKNMTKTTLTILLVMFSMISFSQEYWDYTINFEDTSQFFRLKIDTISNPNNTWQIGPPQKSIFTCAYSLPNAIVTDTIDSYPNNDNSIFNIYHLAQDGFQWPHTVILSGKYRVDTDTLSDHGSIEFSPDNGITWVNLLTDTYYYNQNCYEWYSEKPTLSGFSGDWKEFYVFLAGFNNVFNIQWNDTVIYRFSFYSDNNHTNRDGLMYDNLHFEDWAEFVESRNQNDINTIIYPNPAFEKIFIGFDNPKMQDHSIWIYNETGKQIFIKENVNANSSIINIDNWGNGIYYVKLKNMETNQSSVGKFLNLNKQ